MPPLPLLLLLFLPFLVILNAQSVPSSPTPTTPTNSTHPNSTSASVTVSLTTNFVLVTSTTRSEGGLVTFTTLRPTVVNATHTLITPTPTTSGNSTSTNSTESASQTPDPLVLATILDPAFGVLGALLVLTGLPSAFWGHKNRWTSFFLIGFYSLALVCFVLIIRFGVLPSVNPPGKTLRGMFVLSCGVAGVAGGGVAIFFWKGARYFIGAWGGFALALWIQCFQNGGLIKPVGYRWILYLGCAVVGFILCTIPRIHYHVLLISTAVVGSSAFMLGVDCFTTAGLKEFYVWNIGFRSLFPRYTNNGIQFPVSQTMQIEIGLAAAITLMGIAVQLRILRVLQHKLEEIAEEQRKRDEEAEQQTTDRFTDILREREQWEKQHPTLGKHGRNASGMSGIPLMKAQRADTPSPISAEHRSSTFTLVNEGRHRYKSNLSDFLAAPTPEEDLRRAARNQSPGVLPALDLGLDIQDDVPRSFITKEQVKDHVVNRNSAGRDISTTTTIELGDLKRKEELMTEILTIRRSIDALKAETPAPSSSTESRRPSLTSRRTLSIDPSTTLQPSIHLRPPRSMDPRVRVQSLDITGLAASLGESINRPTSVPSRPDDWDAYVQDRKLLQPPAGITAPIPTSPVARAPLPPAVNEALQNRKRRESVLGFGDQGSSENVPLAKMSQAKKSNSVSSNFPVTILPPRKQNEPIVAPTPQRPSNSRVRTFEELNERHREKMRDLQAPLTQVEKENAELEAAKQRWERSKALEKDVVLRRQAEKAAEFERRKKMEGELNQTRRRSADARASRHSRSLSVDKLAGSGASRRLSTMKVEDWQRRTQAEAMKREGRPVKTDTVPVYDPSKPRGRQSRDIAG